MNLDEACSIVGVCADTDRKTLRRQYHRMLRKHPPETDPEGFKRLRAAYELLQTHADRDHRANSASPPLRPSKFAPRTPMIETRPLPSRGEGLPIEHPTSIESPPSVQNPPSIASPPPVEHPPSVEIPPPIEIPPPVNSPALDEVGPPDPNPWTDRKPDTSSRAEIKDIAAGIDAVLHHWAASEVAMARAAFDDLAFELGGGAVAGRRVPESARIRFVIAEELHAVAGELPLRFASEIARAVVHETPPRKTHAALLGLMAKDREGAEKAGEVLAGKTTVLRNLYIRPFDDLLQAKAGLFPAVSPVARFIHSLIGLLLALAFFGVVYSLLFGSLRDEIQESSKIPILEPRAFCTTLNDRGQGACLELLDALAAEDCERVHSRAAVVKQEFVRGVKPQWLQLTRFLEEVSEACRIIESNPRRRS